MPRVPIDEYQQRTSPLAADAVVPRAISVPFSGAEAQGGERLGAALGSDAATVADYAAKFKRENDANSVNDAYTNTFSPQFRDLYSGYYGLQGKDAIDQYPDYAKKMQDLRQQVRDGLPNDQQKREFDDASRRRVEAELDGMSRHAQQQRQVWMASTSDAALSNISVQAADKYNDENAFGAALRSGIAEVDRYGTQTGQSSEVMRARAMKWVSSAWTQRLTRMSLDDPLSAQNLYQAHQSEIDPATRPVLESHLKTAVTPVLAKAAADHIMAGGDLTGLGNAEAVVGEPLINAVMTQESGGSQGAQSPRGAVGVMQLMPDTAREVAGQMGVAYDEARLRGDATYNKALGSQYLKNMLARYGGNQTLALAAYNAGPKNVDKWVSTIGNPATGQISDADFAAAIPFKETRDYVTRINAAVPSSAQAPTNSRDTRAQMAVWLSQAEKTADVMRPGDPVFKDLLVSNIKSRVATITQMQDGAQRQAQGQLITAVVGDGQTPGPTTMSALLADPNNKQAWQTIDPAAKTGIIALVDRNARGDQVTTNPQLVQSLFQRIHADDSDPSKIRSPAQLTQYFGKQADSTNGVNRSDYDWLSKELNASQTPEGSSFLKDVASARSAGRRMLVTNIAFTGQQDKGEEAAYRFARDLDTKIDQYRKDGKDPRLLLTPGTPDYALDPNKVASYVPHAATVVSDAAAKAAAAKYTVGQTYDFKQGKMKYLGGDPNQAASWSKS